MKESMRKPQDGMDSDYCHPKIEYTEKKEGAYQPSHDNERRPHNEYDAGKGVKDVY